MKEQLKTICGEIVKLIQETNEENVQEQANALFEKIKWINDQERSIKTAIPDNSTKRFSFMLKNRQNMEICRGIAFCRDGLQSSQKTSAVESLKRFEECYSKLWF